MKTCVNCGTPRPVRGEYVRVVPVAGRVFEGTAAGFRCGKCKVVYFDGPALAALEGRIGVKVAELGPPSADGLCCLHDILAIPATELAALLDIRPETLSRWEHGKGTIDRNAWLVVGDLIRDKAAGRDDTVRRLRALGKPIRGKTVRVA